MNALKTKVRQKNSWVRGTDAIETPVGSGDVAGDGGFFGGDGRELGDDGVDIGVGGEALGVGEDVDLAGDVVTAGIEAGRFLAFFGFGASGFLCVGAVGCETFGRDVGLAKGFGKGGREVCRVQGRLVEEERIAVSLDRLSREIRSLKPAQHGRFAFAPIRRHERFRNLEAGDSLDEFLDNFPSVSREAATAALQEARALLTSP